MHDLPSRTVLVADRGSLARQLRHALLVPGAEPPLLLLDLPAMGVPVPPGE